MAGREQIYGAIFGLLQQLNPTASLPGDDGTPQPAGNGTFVVPVSRRYKSASESESQPCLYMMEVSEEPTYPAYNAPRKQEMTAHLIIYSNTGADPTIVPAVALNNILDAVEAAVRPGPHEQTLGGLVTWVRFAGRTTVFTGDMASQAITVMELNILATV
jgi:hypothetical protein